MISEEALAQVQAGTIAALVAVADAIIEAGAVDRDRVIDRLQTWSGSAMRSELGPLGQSAIDCVIAGLRLRPSDESGGH